MLLESGGAARVYDANSLYETAAMLLRDHDRSKNMGKRAFEVFYANKGAVEKTVDAIKGILMPQ
jgi:3-deoxy-D-manno-octulosonic-acid transferase